MLLNEAQQRTLQAAVNRIIPPDEHPGGWEAGVGDYLERQLLGDLHPLAQTYKDGLDAMNREALAVYGAAFADLDADRQDSLLKRIESGPSGAADAGLLLRFFRLLIDHTAEGYYSDPGNGGNRNGVAWEMIGFHVTT